jgi:hypothetical protein
MARALLFGGPFDGGDIAVKRATFVWVSEAGRGFHASAVPKATGELYRSAGVHGDNEVYVYAGHSHWRCRGCGGFNARSVSACQMCGDQVAV